MLTETTDPGVVVHTRRQHSKCLNRLRTKLLSFVCCCLLGFLPLPLSAEVALKTVELPDLSQKIIESEDADGGGSTAVESLAEISLLVHPDVEDQELDFRDLRAIFTMRRRDWSNGEPVTVFVLPDHDPVHALFCEDVLRSFPYQLRRVWQRMLFTGAGLGPQEVSSEAQMVLRVANTPGSIGYVSRHTDVGSARRLPLRTTPPMSLAGQ